MQQLTDFRAELLRLRSAERLAKKRIGETKRQQQAANDARHAAERTANELAGRIHQLLDVMHAQTAPPPGDDAPAYLRLHQERSET